jgi:hypothetical protein
METQPSRCASLRVIKPDWGTMPPLNTINPSAGWSHLAEAVEFAFALHADQRRKGTTIPYVAHLMSVAALVLEHGGDALPVPAHCPDYRKPVESHSGADSHGLPPPPTLPDMQVQITPYVVHFAEIWTSPPAMIR